MRPLENGPTARVGFSDVPHVSRASVARHARPLGQPERRDDIVDHAVEVPRMYDQTMLHWPPGSLGGHDA